MFEELAFHRFLLWRRVERNAQSGLAKNWNFGRFLTRQLYESQCRVCDSSFQSMHRYTLFTFNLIFFICGLAVLGIGIWILVN
jgi:hypothetical protein